ncbi:MAG: YceI family protein, partial [Candidatus Eremiobacteraeota bacterium]|nr:YceI family protein [Candidatus Eremiobacteraeota bacterium]
TKFPTIVFKSTKITPGNDGAFTVVGDLTIHGVTKPVTLAGKMLGTATDGRGRKHIGYTASGTIDRRDFGISFMGSMGGALIAGTDVTLEIESEMVSR